MATVVVAVVAIAVGVGGGAYLWKEGFPTSSDETSRDGGIRDAAPDARAGRGKPKGGKRVAGRAKPRAKPVNGGGGKVDNGTSDNRTPNSGSPDNGSPDNGNADDDSDEVVEFHPPFRGRGPAGPTYEAALASNRQEITIGSQGERDLTDAQLSGPMGDGAFVGECGAPDAMKVTVKVAVKQGRPAGVTVFTRPHDPDIAGCIDRYVRTFSWPSNAKMDSFTTTY